MDFIQLSRLVVVDKVGLTLLKLSRQSIAICGFCSSGVWAWKGTCCIIRATKQLSPASSVIYCVGPFVLRISSCKAKGANESWGDAGRTCGQLGVQLLALSLPSHAHKPWLQRKQ